MSLKRSKIGPSRIDSSVGNEVKVALTWLKRHSTKRTLAGMARYGLPSENALGVSVSDLHLLAKKLGRNHLLAVALWKTGCYEARMDFLKRVSEKVGVPLGAADLPNSGPGE